MRLALAVLCVTSLFAITADSQTSRVVPLHIAAGTVVTFHVQSRLRPSDGDALNPLPPGTPLPVKLADAIDSTKNRDGSEFRGTLVTQIASGGAIIHEDAEVRGILVLLRSKSHPDGFRYELMITGISEQGQSHALTASLGSSFFEDSPSSVSPAHRDAKNAPLSSRP
jgi:hypothetical protein